MPKRIQRKRTKGWKMPENAVYVGRPTKWGNPFKIGTIRTIIKENHQTLTASMSGKKVITRKEALDLYEKWINQEIEFGNLDLHELRGKNLACWCPLDKPCHADILLRLANE